MGLYAFLVNRKESEEMVLDCRHFVGFSQRLCDVGKFQTGRWVEFRAEQLAHIEAQEDWTPEEQQVVNSVKSLIENNGGRPVCLECFGAEEA
jgi:hypothetical protein